jgi:hypothetical protein
MSTHFRVFCKDGVIAGGSEPDRAHASPTSSCLPDRRD